MEDQKITDSSPALEPAPTSRKRALRTRAIHAVQDDVPHYATSRREPRRAGLALEHARACARIAEDNRGKDILLLDLRKTTPIVDFMDSVSVSWELTSNGEISVSAFGTGGGTWIDNVNAGGFCINNLGCINGIPIGNFLTNPINQNVNFNGWNIYGLNGLSAFSVNTTGLVVGSEGAVFNSTAVFNGEIFYQGQPLQDLLGFDYWTLSSDGSIFRDSDVYVNGLLTVTDPTFTAMEARVSGAYVGEIGWDSEVVELWTTNSLILRGWDNQGLYIPIYTTIGGSQLGQGNAMLSIVDTAGHFGVICNHVANDVGGAGYFAWKTRGTQTVPLPVQLNDQLMYFGWAGLNTTFPNANQGALLAEVTNASGASDLIFFINDGTDTSQDGPGQERMRLPATGPYSVNVTGNVNASGCYYIKGQEFACLDAGGNIHIPDNLLVEGNLTTQGSLSSDGTLFLAGMSFAAGNSSGGLDMFNIQNINGTPYNPGGGGGFSTFVGNLNLTIMQVAQNNYGKPLMVVASGGYSVVSGIVAMAIRSDGNNPPLNTVAYASHAVAASFTLVAVIQPGDYFQVYEYSSGGGVNAVYGWY